VDNPVEAASFTVSNFLDIDQALKDKHPSGGPESAGLRLWIDPYECISLRSMELKSRWNNPIFRAADVDRGRFAFFGGIGRGGERKTASPVPILNFRRKLWQQ
jgi:hypothetical protein